MAIFKIYLDWFHFIDYFSDHFFRNYYNLINWIYLGLILLSLRHSINIYHVLIKTKKNYSKKKTFFWYQKVLFFFLFAALCVLTCFQVDLPIRFCYFPLIFRLLSVRYFINSNRHHTIKSVYFHFFLKSCFQFQIVFNEQTHTYSQIVSS